MKIRNYILAPFRVGVFLLALFLHSSFIHAQIITTVAGDSTAGYNGDNIPATTAELYQATGVAVDAAGNIYIADRNNNLIRKVNTSGIITTIAGTGAAAYSGDNGPATAAEINYPYGITLDTLGNIYFSDDFNYRIRKINTAGIITTIAGNGTAGYNGDGIAATSAELQNPGGVAVDHNGNVYIADVNNDRIRIINTAGIITTIAGTGAPGYNGDNIAATAAELYQPEGVAVDNVGNLYIVEYINYRVRKVDASGIITTIAGTGISGYNGDNITATTAELDRPLGVAVDGNGNVYISDAYNARIRKINSSGIINTIAGTGISAYSGDNGLATAAELSTSVGITIDHSGNVYIADAGNSRIRRIISNLSVNNVPIDRLNLTVYPNPAPNGQFTISISSNTNEKVNIIITDLLGEKIKDFTVETNRPMVVQLDVLAGIYVLSANDGYCISTTKLFINKCC